MREGAILTAKRGGPRTCLDISDGRYTLLRCAIDRFCWFLISY